MMRNFGLTKPHSGFTDDGLGDPFEIANDPNVWLAPAAPPQVVVGPETAAVGDLGVFLSESAGNLSGSATVSSMAAAPAQTTVTTAGSSLVINLSWDTSVSSAPSGFMNDIIAVAHYLEGQITNAVTININVGYNEIGGSSLENGALGESQTNLLSVSYSVLAKALTNTRSTDPTDTAVLASLPATSPVSGTYWVTDAQAKALGLLSANGISIDGEVGFGLSSQFTYGDTNTNSAVGTGIYDFFATAAHEITEIMGRLLLVGQNVAGGPGYSLLDLLHYSASGTRDFTRSTAGYLSVDGGTTNLGDFNTNPSGDAGDWASSVGNNSFNAFATAGALEPVTANDLTEMDAIGWNFVGSQTAVMPPTISGTVAGQAVTDQATISPFLHATIADSNAGQTETVTVALSATANGTLSNLGAGSYNASAGVYTVIGSAAAVTTALDELVFMPTAHQVPPGQSVITGFTIRDTDTDGFSTTDSTTTVIATAIAIPPTISGTVGGQTLTDQAVTWPFLHVTIADANAGQTETVTVTLSATANGTLSNLGAGSYNASTGIYTVTGSAEAVTATLYGWVFNPTPLEAPAGQTVTTSVTISVTDTAGKSASDNTTSIITTETNNTGLIGILSADQQLELIYIAYFGRAADGPGLTFWSGQDVQAQAAGQSTALALTNIANSFTPQPETLALYPFLGTPNLDLSSPDAQAGLSTFIDNVYRNLFGHVADANGKAYWVGQLTSGSVGLGAAALAIANGATGTDSIELQNKITIAFDFTTRTASAGLGNTVPLAGSFVTAAHTVLNGVDGNWLNDASTTAGISATTTYISASTTSTATTDSAATGTIMITGSDQLIDPGTGSHIMQFVAGASADTLVLHTNGADQIAGFDLNTDILDFRSLLSEANVDLNGDITALGMYLTITDQGSDAVLGFDPTGHGSGYTVAVLQGLGSTVTGLDTLVAHAAIRIA